jgi:SAM-dependent methyltransferase
MSFLAVSCPICLNDVEIPEWDAFHRETQPINCSHRTFSGVASRASARWRKRCSTFIHVMWYASSLFVNALRAFRGLSDWLRKNCVNYLPTGYFPEHPLGSVIHGLRNENLEALTLADASVDVWLHLDVMEHLFHPFQAMREIHRTLRPGGVCLFTAPTYPDRVKSEQVAFREADGSVRVVGEPEYHGNPQSPQGSLVTWRFGYDLAERVSRECGFDVEVRRWWAPSIGVAGPMTEVYICRKPSA